MANNGGSRNTPLVPQADQTSRANGSVGGEMVKRMIELAERQLGGGSF